MPKCQFCNAELESSSNICFQCGSVQKQELEQAQTTITPITNFETYVPQKDEDPDAALNAISKPSPILKWADLGRTSIGSINNSFSSNTNSSSINNFDKLDFSDYSKQGHLAFGIVLLLCILNYILINSESIFFTVVFGVIGAIIGIGARIKQVWLERYSWVLIIGAFLFGYYSGTILGPNRYFDTTKIMSLPLLIGIITHRWARFSMNSRIMTTNNVPYIDPNVAKKKVLSYLVLSVGVPISIALSVVLRNFWIFIIYFIFFFIGICYNMITTPRYSRSQP